MGDLTENFSRTEFECKCGCGADFIDYELVSALQWIREDLGLPIAINSGTRCASHNSFVGGKSTSQHLYGKAVDMRVVGMNAYSVASYLEGRYPDKYGIGRYPGRTHFDVRAKKARWYEP